MTDDRAALVEKVAEELWQADSVRVTGCRRSVPWSEAGPAAHNQWRPLATAAVALIRAEVLEEARRAVREHIYMLNLGTPEEGPFSRQDRVCKEVMEQADAAIRALKDKA